MMLLDYFCFRETQAETGRDHCLVWGAVFFTYAAIPYQKRWGGSVEL
jgi:hypothetical protein